MGLERTGTPFLFFLEPGTAFRFFFHDVEPFICYFLIRDSYFYVLFVVHCTLHASHVPSLNLRLSGFLSRWPDSLELVANLPDELRNYDSSDGFKRFLKTYLFSRY